DRNRSHWSTSKTPSYTKSVSWQHHPGCQPSFQLTVISHHIALRENWQGYRGVPSQNSRSATPLSVYFSPFLAIIFALALPHFSQKP
ncbi:hypothetical protein ACJEJX_23905, partial [Escherichia coli]